MKLHMCVYLRAKFEVSSISVMSFRQRGGGIILPPPPPQNEPLQPHPDQYLKKQRQ